jgi:DNA-binding response OmpR family regulator
MKRLLVVEDEPAIAESLAYALRRAGYETVVAQTYREAWEAREGAALIVLDLMLPDGSGFDLISALRSAKDATPIIVLSSRDGEADRVAALDSGADDYVTKPFSPREVVARIGAVLRRPPPSDARATPLSLDPDRRSASYRGLPLDLTRVEFDLLGALLEQPGHVQSRPQLIARVWGDGFAITDRTIDSHIKSLRKKLAEAGASGDVIATVRGVGYRIAEPE